jgi:hypothetical protein
MESIVFCFTFKSKTSTDRYFFSFFDGNLSQESNAKKTDWSTLINSEFNRKLSIIDGQRIKDSIKKVELETKLPS